jgi:hypothetical protein
LINKSGFLLLSSSSSSDFSAQLIAAVQNKPDLLCQTLTLMSQIDLLTKPNDKSTQKGVNNLANLSRLVQDSSSSSSSSSSSDEKRQQWTLSRLLELHPLLPLDSQGQLRSNVIFDCPFCENAFKVWLGRTNSGCVTENFRLHIQQHHKHLDITNEAVQRLGISDLLQD